MSDLLQGTPSDAYKILLTYLKMIYMFNERWNKVVLDLVQV